MGVESVTAEGLKSVFKEFNSAGDDLADAAQHLQGAWRACAGIIHLWASYRPRGYLRGDGRTGQTGRLDLRAIRDDDSLSRHRGLRSMGEEHERERPVSVDGVPITRYWLIPASVRPKMFSPHETMTTEEIRERTQGVWDSFLQPAGDLEAVEVRAHAARRAWRSCSSPSCIARCTRTRAFRRTAPGGRRRHGWRAGWRCRAASYSKRSRCRSSKCRPCGGLRG